MINKVYQVSAGQISLLVLAGSKKKAKKHVKDNSVYANNIAPIDGVRRVKAKKPEILGTYRNGDFIPGILENNPEDSVTSLKIMDEGAITLNYLQKAGIELNEEQLAKLRIQDAKETRELVEA